MANSASRLPILESSDFEAKQEVSPSRLSLENLAALGALLFLATASAVRLSGLFLDFPWGLIALFAVSGLPFSVCMHWFAQLDVNRRFAMGWPICLALSIAILLGNHYWQVWPVLAVLLWTLSIAKVGVKLRLSNGSTLLLTSAVLASGYAVVWNLNFLLMRYMPLQRWDPWVRSLDLEFYRLVFGREVDLTGLFPLVSHPVLLQLFDNAYAVLIPEVVLLAFLFSQRPDRRAVSDYLRWLFGFYLVGILIYACFPVNGPHLYYPEQQDLTRSLPTTVAFAKGMMHDYEVAKVGGQLTGFGYFIAVPSLHVLAAIFLQHSLRAFPVLFRVFLPINIALCLSTVILGYHYVFDSVAAAAVYILAIGVARIRRRMPAHLQT